MLRIKDIRVAERKPEIVSVLIIDDDPAIVRLLRLIFRSEGILCQAASSGEEALAMLRDGRAEPRVILLDLALPGISGREVFRAIRGLGFDCPIVFCSAQGAATANRQLGGQGFIEKPFDIESLVTKVRSLAESHDSRLSESRGLSPREPVTTSYGQSQPVSGFPNLSPVSVDGYYGPRSRSDNTRKTPARGLRGL